MTEDARTSHFPAIGARVRLKSNAKRYHGGEATVLGYENRGHKTVRKFVVVSCGGKEICVMPGEIE